MLFKRLRIGITTLPVWRRGEQDAYTGDPDQPHTRMMVTAYAATLDTKFIDDSIAILSGSPEAGLWGDYLTSLNTVLHSRGSPSHWPSSLKSTFSKLLAVAISIHMCGPTIDPYMPDDSFASVWDIVTTAFTDGDVVIEDDNRLYLAALRTANRQYKLAHADRTWSELFFAGYMGRIQNAVTYRTSMSINKPC